MHEFGYNSEGITNHLYLGGLDGNSSHTDPTKKFRQFSSGHKADGMLKRSKSFIGSASERTRSTSQYKGGSNEDDGSSRKASDDSRRSRSTYYQYTSGFPSARSVAGSHREQRSQSQLTRSSSMRDLHDRSGRAVSISPDIVRAARELVKDAVKKKHIFTVMGPYHRVREVLRSRGWVEKIFVPNPSGPSLQPSVRRSAFLPGFHHEGDDADDSTYSTSYHSNRTGSPQPYTPRNDMSTAALVAQFNAALHKYSRGSVDSNIVIDSRLKISPWEESNGIYSMMSRLVKNEDPSFIWTLRTRDIDYRYLRKDQIVNHHAKSACFTTKVGLCQNLRQLYWYENQNPDVFFPRCYILNTEDEKDAFIEDFKLTACMAIVKIVAAYGVSISSSEDGVEVPTEVEDHGESADKAEESEASPDLSEETTKVEEEQPLTVEQSEPVNTSVSRGSSAGSARRSPSTKSPIQPSTSESDHDKNNTEKVLPKIRYSENRVCGMSVSYQTIDFALRQCERYLEEMDHCDIDSNDVQTVDEHEWNQFILRYYRVVKQGATITGAHKVSPRCAKLCTNLKRITPQFEMDGVKNVWIVKPGAMSRGRGITCLNDLRDILSMASTTGSRSDKFVVQKYIERPLLVYNTKFDIRQWFLVTDWNPLTIFWYKDAYLRFCSQEFTLEDFDESVHLANNSIQHKYQNGSTRSEKLPEDNMWDCHQFKEYLTEQGHPLVWDAVVKPGMKEAISSCLLCAQDSVDLRKNSFEVYGADFMITDDFTPLLIEINSSPCMAPSTQVTSQLTYKFIEDTAKVIIDQMENPTCNIGNYELLCRQPVIPLPLQTSINLSISGRKIKPSWNSATTGPVVKETTSSLAVSSAASQRRNKQSDSKQPDRNNNDKHLKPVPSTQTPFSSAVMANRNRNAKSQSTPTNPARTTQRSKQRALALSLTQNTQRYSHKGTNSSRVWPTEADNGNGSINKFLQNRSDDLGTSRPSLPLLSKHSSVNSFSTSTDSGESKKGIKQNNHIHGATVNTNVNLINAMTRKGSKAPLLLPQISSTSS